MAANRKRRGRRTGNWWAASVRWAVIVALSFDVAPTACVSRPAPAILKASAAAADTRRVTVFVATVRSPQPGSAVVFTDGHASTLRFARYVISIPPSHRVSAIEWPGNPPNSASEFVTVEADSLTEGEFRAGIGEAGETASSVRLFVHGYNNSYQETVYRLAQIAQDLKDGRTAVLFAWPSRGSTFSYNADRAAALASTDGLARTLELIGSGSNRRHVLLAHSMGGWLTMETLASMSGDRRRAVAEQFSNIVLAAPDIDVTEMANRLEVIGRMPRPLTLLVSRDDAALTVSGLISGRRRVGADDVHDPWVQAAARQFGARVIDISELEAADGFRHARYTSMVALYSAFQSQIENPAGRHYAGSGTFVFRAATSTLEPVR